MGGIGAGGAKSRHRRHSWPKIQASRQMEEMATIEEMGKRKIDKFSPKVMKRKLTIMEVGQMKSPRELLERANEARKYGESDEYTEESVKFEFDNYSSAAIAAATTSTDQEQAGERVSGSQEDSRKGSVAGIKYRRKSAPNSGNYSGERRKSFAGLNLEHLNPK